MENRVRDLEQLEERDPEDRGRRIGTVVMATLGIVALTFAMGVVVGKAAEPGDAEKDPLDQLDRVASAAMKPSVAQAQAAEPAVKVDPTGLNFQRTLTEDEDRPEVLAALEAAAREEAGLAAAQATPPAATGTLQAAEDSLRAVKQDQPDTDNDDAAEQDAVDSQAEARVPGVLPASVAAGSAGHQLQRAAKHDQLVAAALPMEGAKETAAHGEAGEFTLQVISYDAPEPAQAFASSLRTKGHEAFVTAADVADRGRYYRVRIGPFAVREKAEAYRRKFENDEHMNTIVVKRAKDSLEH